MKTTFRTVLNTFISCSGLLICCQAKAANSCIQLYNYEKASCYSQKEACGASNSCQTSFNECIDDAASDYKDCLGTSAPNPCVQGEVGCNTIALFSNSRVGKNTAFPIVFIFGKGATRAENLPRMSF